jgi:hypothetical protein
MMLMLGRRWNVLCLRVTCGRRFFVALVALPQRFKSLEKVHSARRTDVSPVTGLSHNPEILIEKTT